MNTLPILKIRTFEAVTTGIGEGEKSVRPFILVRPGHRTDMPAGFVWLDPRSFVVGAEEAIRHAAYSSPVAEQTPTNWMNVSTRPGNVMIYLTRMVGLAQVLATPHLRETLPAGDDGEAFWVHAIHADQTFTGVWADSVGAAARFVRDVGVYFSALPR